MNTDSDTTYRQYEAPPAPPTPASLISAAIAERGLNPASFGREFGEGLGATIPRQTIHYWVDGKFSPARRIMFLAAQVYPADDWRAMLARSILALYDGNTQPEGEENE